MPVGPGKAPDGAVRTGAPAGAGTDDGDRATAAEPPGEGEPSEPPIPPVAPARVTMLSRNASGSAVPPNSMPPRRGRPGGSAPADQGADAGPSELFDPGGPAGPARPDGPAERFRTSQLFEPFTPVTPVTPPPGEAGRPAAPDPTVPWGSMPSASSDGRGETPAGGGSGDAPRHPSTPTTSAPGGDGPAGEEPARSPGEDGSPSETGRAPATPAVGPPGETSPPTPPAGWAPVADGPGSGAHGGPATAPASPPPPHGVAPAAPHGPPPGGHGPPSVPAGLPAQAGPSTLPPAPAAPPAGRQRRLPVVLLVVAVLVAGLGYVGYRQLTGGPPDGFRAATSPGFEMAVPQTWTPPTPGTSPLTVFGVPFGTAGQYGDYACRNARFPRAVAASALIAVPANVGLDQAATAFARGSGEALYPGAGPQVAVGTPSQQELSRVTGSRVEATVRTDGSGGCRATDATVQVLVVPRTTASDGSIGAAVLVVSGDLRGGPPQPAPVTRDELIRVLDTAALSTA